MCIKETPVSLVSGGRSPFVYRGDRVLYVKGRYV